MKVILVDDEPAMHLILRKMLAKLPGVEVAGAFADTRSAAAFLNEAADIQLAFVDIAMPGESGMKFAAKLAGAGSPVQIVFVTSHKEYAVKAYELAVLDYLVKPLAQERLERAVNRALAGKRARKPLPDQGPGQLVVTVLGDVIVRNDLGRARWISRKSEELFAYLLLHRGLWIPRSRLIADLLAGMTPQSADIYLTTVVSQLQNSLEPLNLRAAVRSNDEGYAMELNEVSIDYAEFEGGVAKLPSLETPGHLEAASQLERLYAGDLFGDKAYVWAINETERLAAMYLTFGKRLADTFLSMSDLTAASKLLVKLHARNPLNESVVRLVLQVHAASRDAKALKAQYADYVRLLERELGIRPSQELEECYRLLESNLSR